MGGDLQSAMIHFNFPPILSRARTRAYIQRISGETAWMIVVALMFPSALMPMASSVVRVASPLFRDAFLLSAESLAWLSMSFTIPFMVLMPVYCSLSQMVGRRRLILAGTAVFVAGVIISMSAPRFAVLMLGQGIQGFGAAGMMPLGMAYIAAIFERSERGKALGTWSSVGPTIAFIGPLLAGIILATWNWRATFVLPLIMGVLALVAVTKGIPPGYSNIQPHMWRRFDWPGVGLLALALTSFFAFLSSRPITGAEPLTDWRLAVVMLLFLSLFVWRERTATNPFIDLDLYRQRLFRQASFGAALRMTTMGATGLLIPLFLADLYQVEGVAMGIMLMINPAAMSLMVRYGGQIADRWGSRWPLMVGFTAQMLVLATLFLLPEGVPLWSVGCVLAAHGLGVGTMLAALHRTALLDISEAQANVASGMYSFVRFVGVAIGTSVAGVLFTQFHANGWTQVESYKTTFLCFTLAAVTGLVLALRIDEKPVSGN